MNALKKTILAFCILFSSVGKVADFSAHEGYIASLNYPKFSLVGDFSVYRHFLGFADERLRISLSNRFDTGMSFEAGILRYMNVGAIFSGSISKISKQEPIDFRMGLFVKPFLPLGDRVALFSRLTGGLVVSLCISGPSNLYYAGEDEGDNFKEVYQGQDYKNFPVGGYLAASFGMEIFLFSRVGLSLEAGARTSFFYTGKKMPFMEGPKDVPGSPNSFNFMTYELPIGITLHVIL